MANDKVEQEKEIARLRSLVARQSVALTAADRLRRSYDAQACYAYDAARAATNDDDQEVL